MKKLRNEGMKNRENVILIKSYNFAKRIVKLYLHLSKEKNEYVLSKQLLRSGISIGANIEESQAGQSKKDFIAKVQNFFERSKRNTLLVASITRYPLY